MGKVAVVTGASAGIGAAITLDLIKSGMIVIGLARRPEKVSELKKQLPNTLAVNLSAYKCDVGIEDDVNKAFYWIEQQFGGVDVLINNAGIAASTNLLDDGNTNLLKSIIDTNVLGIILCTRNAFQSMKKRGIDGHVILINSTLGQNLGGVAFNSSFNVYPATKYAVTALTETYRQEFMQINSKTKISVRNIYSYQYIKLCINSESE